MTHVEGHKGYPVQALRQALLGAQHNGPYARGQRHSPAMISAAGDDGDTHRMSAKKSRGPIQAPPLSYRPTASWRQTILTILHHAHGLTCSTTLNHNQVYTRG